MLRGRYMAAVARMESNGVPVDLAALDQLRQHWEALQEKLVARIDAGRGIYEGTHFRSERWATYLAQQNIPWPRLASGQLALDDDTFRQMARCYPEQVGPIRELRHTLSQLRPNELAVGRDGRNRCLLSPFGARTGRNTPSNSKFVFGPSVWLRGLIRPEPGMALASDLRFWGNRGDSCRKSSFPRPSRASQRRRARYSSDGAEDRLRRPWCIVIVSAAERYFTETADLKPYSFFAILLPAFGPNLFFLLLAEPPWHRRRPS